MGVVTIYKRDLQLCKGYSNVGLRPELWNLVNGYFQPNLKTSRHITLMKKIIRRKARSGLRRITKKRDPYGESDCSYNIYLGGRIYKAEIWTRLVSESTWAMRIVIVYEWGGGVINDCMSTSNPECASCIATYEDGETVDLSRFLPVGSNFPGWIHYRLGKAGYLPSVRLSDPGNLKTRDPLIPSISEIQENEARAKNRDSLPRLEDIVYVVNVGRID